MDSFVNRLLPLEAQANDVERSLTALESSASRVLSSTQGNPDEIFGAPRSGSNQRVGDVGTCALLDVRADDTATMLATIQQVASQARILDSRIIPGRFYV